MSLLDVTEVLDDPLFHEPAVWIQRFVFVDANGIASYTNFETAILVVPNAGDGDTLNRKRDASKVFSTVRFYTRAPLSPGNHGTDSDRVRWRGRTYQMLSVSDWTNWGRGFVSAACELIPPDGGVEAPP